MAAANPMLDWRLSIASLAGFQTRCPWRSQNRSPLQAKRLETLPKDWLTALQTTAVELDVEQCLELIHQMDPVDLALSRQLQALVNQFDFEGLLKLL
ncbi:MAG: hypothetical protein WAW36_06840 [Methylovulum miyakonense]|uniref:hypothetical protein n=1 Tax=Methylovulum miyakonense TaxID=645578 RepID=UPI003BB623A3